MCLFGTYCNIVTIETVIILFLFLGILLSFLKKKKVELFLYLSPYCVGTSAETFALMLNI